MSSGPDNVQTASPARCPDGVSIEEAAQIDEGWVEKTFRKTIESEERVIMMRELIAKGVGLAEVENFFGDLAQKCRNVGNRSRKESLIKFTMKVKYQDALKDRDYWRVQKARTIKKVIAVWGSRSPRKRSLFRRLIESSDQLRENLKAKYRDKIEHLYRKFKEEQEIFCLPDDLLRYKTVKCLQPDYKPPEAPTDREPLVLGGVVLDSDEKQAMLLDPKFAVLDKLSEEDWELEVQCCLTKLRWDKMAEDRLSKDITEEEREKTETHEAEERQIFDPITKTIDYRKYRATDAPMNATLHLPPGQTPEYEAGLEIRFQEWMGVGRKYIEEFCTEGKQETNLTPAQKRGLKKLKKRVAEGELVCVTTDKSGRLAIMPLELYEAAGEVHCSQDREVTMEFAEETARQLRGHTSAWLKNLNIGENHNHQDRHRKTFISHTLNIAEMYLLYKDHKFWDGGPIKTRPVASAINGFNVQYSNLLSPILEALADAMKNNYEIISTEDGLSKIDQFNLTQPQTKTFSEKQFCFSDPKFVSNNKCDAAEDKMLSFLSPCREGTEAECGAEDGEAGYETDEYEFQEEKEADRVATEKGDYLDKELVFCGSVVCALFPSCTAKMAGDAVRKAVLETDIEFEGVDYKELGIYVAMNCSTWEISQAGLSRWVPVRAKQRGAKPGVTGAGVMGPTKKGNNSMWKFTRFLLTPEAKKDSWPRVWRLLSK